MTGHEEDQDRAADMAALEAAAVRIAGREGITVEDVRERVRRGDAIAAERTNEDATPTAVRTCALAGCDRTFVPRTERHRYCKPAHRAADHRVRTGGAP